MYVRLLTNNFLSEKAVGKSESKDVHLAVLRVLPEVIRESVDADASSKSVIVYDPASGEKKMVSPTAVDGIESLGEVKTAEQREAEINARMQDTIQRGKDWLVGNVANPVGMQIQLGDGRIATIEAMHEDGKSAIATLPDGTQFMVPKDVLQRIVNNGQYADYKARRDAEASKREAEQGTESAPETVTEGGQPLPEEASTKEEESREYAQGDVFDVVVDGQKMHAEIVSPKDADGRFVVNVDDGESMRTLYVTPEELAAMEYREEPLTKAEETRIATEGSSEKALERGEQPTEEHTPTALERIPRDEKGNAQFHDVDTETAWDGLVEMSGNEETAHKVAEASLANAERKLKAAKALKEKGETPEELLRSIKENEAAAAEAQRVVDAWKAIVGEESRREEAAKAEAERIATEKAEAERKAAEERERAEAEEKTRIEAEKKEAERIAAEKAEEEARVEAERKAEEERKTEEEERKERDENGQPFVVSSDGTTTFGEITEDTGLTAAPIKLSEGVADKKGNGYGLRHIEARHGDQIRKAGFSSVEEFVKYVASNYDKHNIKIGKKRANGVETYLIQAEDEHSNVLYVELSKDGSYWNVNSGGIFRKGYAEKKKDVGQNTEHPTSATTLQDKSFVQTDKDNGSQSADTHSDKQHPSADKGTTLPADQQTSDEENTKKVADSEGENTLKAKIEAASAEVNTDPTEAQKEAGNYKKGHVRVGTFDITIEQPEGSIRRGTDADGKKWESKMHNTYGYFRGTEGVDGDHIDVFLSNDIDGWNGRKVFVVDQYNPDGTFDEHKVMLGFNDMDEAKSDYLANYEKGWENGRRITVSTTNLEDFEKWIDSSHRKTKPFSEYSSVNKGSEKLEKKQEKESVFDKAKEIADKEEKKRKAEAEDDSVLGQATRAVGKKKKVNRFKYTASEKNSNLTLRGVHYANGYAYASDGYILFKEKADYPKEWEGTTRDKDGNLIDGKYPDTEKAIHRLVHIPDKEVESLPSKEVLDFAIAASKKLKGEAIPVAIDGIFFNAVNLKKFLEAVASKGMDKVVYRHPMLYATNGKDEIVLMPTVNTLEGALDIADRMERAGLPKEQIDAWKAHIEAADKKKSFDDFKKAVENAKKKSVSPTEAEKPKEQPLTEAERKDAEEVAGALGYRVEWVDTMEENGTIDADKKVIRIAKDAENPLVQVLGHEVTHGVRRMIGGKFRALQKAAKEVAGEKEWNERIEKKRKLNAYAEGKLAEEVTCDIVGEALNDKDALKRLAESLRGERGILARLRDAVAKMVEYFKNRGDKEGVRRMKAADRLLAEFESALKEGEGVNRSAREAENENVERSVRKSRSEKTELTAEERELRDNLVERMRKGGLDVMTDSEEMQRVIDTENERTRMTGAGSVREHRVYHGSGADFDAFDHSHMGEGEGAQAYGWGTYVTEVEGIGKTYANATAHNYNNALRPLERKKDSILTSLRINGSELDKARAGLRNAVRFKTKENYEEFLRRREEIEEKYGKHSTQYDDYLWNSPYAAAVRAIEHYENEIKERETELHSLQKDLEETRKQIENIEKEFPHHLYTVEIPDDNGGNYLDWNGHPAESLLKDVGSFLESEGFERVQDNPVRYEKGESTVVLNPNATGADLYAELREALGSDKKASQALAELGYTGIKYPADNMRGGREDGAKNYVIFNENDAKITDHVRFLRTAGGEVYGLVKDGRIYLDPKVATSETAVHEYTHLWGDMLRRKDSEQWSHTVKELKNSVLWEEVKELYPELKTDDEIADEVLSTFSGRRGAERLHEEARRVADGEGGVFTKAKAMAALERVKEAIARFWEGVARMFGINRYRSAEELADMAMKDLLDSKNPMKDESGMRKRGEVGETLATSGTYFSGGGLLEAGLKGVIDPKVAVEFSEKIAGVYADNHGNHIVVADVRDVDPKKLVGAVDGGEVQYFHASPVCKNFSKAKREGGEVELDKETALSTAEFIAKTRPKVVTIENVKGYRNSEALKIITDELTRQGYDWDADVYNTADYGGYTKRERLIVRAKRDGKLPPKPEKLPEELRKKGWYSAVEDLIPHLEEKKTGVPQGTDERLKNSGIDYRTIDKPLYVFGRGYANKTVGHAFADELLPTLTTGGGDIIIMPDGRVLKASPRVLARVTGLPDTYKMPETDQLSHTIVGNGIPTQLTEGVIAPLLDNAIPSAERATKRESVFDVADRVSQNLEERTRAMRSDEIDRKYPDWLDGTTTDSGRHSTQVEGTRRTYNKVGDWIEKNIGKDAKILDASSGLGYGTADLKKRGFNIEDVEPYQSEERKKNNPATYSSYDDIPKDYDVIISNAVLNVIPDNWRSDVLHNMADHLKPGGIMFINTRKAGEERSIKDKIELDSPQEVLVKRNGKIASYQRFFAPKELKEWVEKELGNGYEVETANDNNSGTKGLAAVVVKKTDADIDRSVREFNPIELSNEDRQKRGDALRGAEPIDVKIKQIVKTKDMSARKAAEKWWKDNVGTSRFYDTEIGLVEINKASVGSSLAHRYSQVKLDAITSLADGFNNAVYLGSMPDFSRQEGVKSHYFAYPINYNGHRNYVFCRAMQDANKNRLYVHEVFLADNIEKGNTLQTAASQPHGGITLYKDILANVLTANVTNNFETSKPRYSRKPGESIFDYASRVSEDVDRSVRERVSARDEYEKKVKSKGFQTKEALQNSMLGLQEFMYAIDHASGNKRYIEDIPDFENPILGENRLSSVNKEEMHQVAKTQFKPLMSAVAKLSGNGKESGELYDYMFAKHGLERDAVMRQREAQKEFDKYQKANPKGTKTIGDFVASLEGKDYAGLTALTAEDGRVKSIQSQIDAIDEQMKATDDQLLLHYLGGQKKRLKVDLLNAARDAADDIRKAFESNPSHDRSDINELWSRVNEVNGNTLRKLYESGMLTKEAYDDISSMYTNYIPMRGFDQTTSADAYAYLTHGDSAFNAPIKTAKGRSSKADNPIAYMQAMAESAIMQGNRNVLVKQKMLNFVRNHPSDLASVSDVWLQYDSVADEWKPFYAFGRELKGGGETTRTWRHIR